MLPIRWDLDTTATAGRRFGFRQDTGMGDDASGVGGEPRSSDAVPPRGLPYRSTSKPMLIVRRSAALGRIRPVGIEAERAATARITEVT